MGGKSKVEELKKKIHSIPAGAVWQQGSFPLYLHFGWMFATV